MKRLVITSGGITALVWLAMLVAVMVVGWIVVAIPILVVMLAHWILRYWRTHRVDPEDWEFGGE